MNPIKIHINQLGLIRNADINLTPVVLFSGESGLGKSYAAILCHYFFYVLINNKRLSGFLKDKGYDFTVRNLDIPDSCVALSLTKNELEKWFAADAVEYIKYMLGYESLNASIIVTLPDTVQNTIDFNYEKEILGVDNAEEIYNKLSVMNVRYRFKSLGLDEENPYAYVLRYALVRSIFGNINSLTSSFVLPPSRGCYLSEEVSSKTGLWMSFENGMKELEKVQEIPDQVSESLIALFRRVMDGEVKKESDKYVYLTHGSTLPISAAAASVREAGPLQVMVSKRDLSKIAILIEEPEAHLHPLKQRMMADIIGTMTMGGANMQITTHSDYFIRRLNDLIRLNILKEKMTEKEFDHFCDDNDLSGEITIDPSILSAYYLEREGDSVRIIHQDSRKGIPFDTFKMVNGKLMSDSAMLYDMTIDEEYGE